ncbi:phosducin-like protein 2 [Tympanuchus pallidicinctus]|uniref:phosducin-like protein 2 n=1 Tax=Tympanuchus pallidicinctus TaxID=109042 RepID=UPI002287054C|nr:phosducin-like protein 2 [Tympanuchus pallidicinctus]
MEGGPLETGPAPTAAVRSHAGESESGGLREGGGDGEPPGGQGGTERGSAVRRAACAVFPWRGALIAQPGIFCTLTVQQSKLVFDEGLKACSETVCHESARGAQVKAIHLCCRKEWSLAPPLLDLFKSWLLVGKDLVWRSPLLVFFFLGEPSIRDPNEDTEWNDVLRKFGILPPKEEPKDESEEMVIRLQKEEEVKPYERMSLEELKEAEDDFDEADRKAIEMYRQQRLQEWKRLQRRQKYGELREISGEQYVKEVTNAPEDVWVIIHLYRPSIPMCLLVNEHLSQLARKFSEAKFVKASVNSCIHSYHDRCLPTILVYKTGEIKARFIGAAECGGMYLKVEELEWKLAEVGAIESDLEENPKKDIINMMTLSMQNISVHENINIKSSDVLKPQIT